MVKAAALKYGSHLHTPGGITATLLSGHNTKIRTGWMWDLTIPTDHDFYIAAGTAAVLVHNCPTAGGGTSESGSGAGNTGTIPARSVRFTQDSISPNFKNGGSTMQLGEDLANGSVSPSDLPAIRIFEQGGDLYSLDNRRLFAGQMANVELPFRMATQEELDAELLRKFTTNNQGTSILMRGVGEFSWFGR